MHLAASSLVIDVNGVGYLVQVTPSLALKCTLGSEVSVHTAFIVREDAFTIYGFDSLDELRTFDLLRSVTGVGPKSALSILHQLGVEELARAIALADDAAFKKVSGIGPKTAKLLVLALSGKLAVGSAVAEVSATDNDVIAALVGLGYQTKAATDAVKNARQNSKDALQDEILRSALKYLAA